MAPTTTSNPSSSSPLYYTPFDCFPAAAQTPSGLLEMVPYEVEVSQRPNIELRSGMMEPMVPLSPHGQPVALPPQCQWMDRMVAHQLQLTTHRLVFWKDEELLVDKKSKQPSSASTSTSISRSSSSSTSSSRNRQARYLHLSHVIMAAAEARHSFLSSPKIALSTYLGDLLLVFRTQQERDQLVLALNKTLSRKEWEHESSKTTQYEQQRSALVSHKVGVDAVLAKNRIRHQQAAQVTQQALEGDAEQLLQEATELVAIIHKYVATLEKHEGSTNTSMNDDDDDASDTAKLAGMLQDMGMTAALNKADFQGRLEAYYQQVARQLADVLRPKLIQQGGVMTLTDAYCFYNRARASNLLSPEDLRRAVESMNGLNLGLSQRIFPSGLVVLQEESVSDKQVATKLATWAAKPDGLTELEAARWLKTSALLAHEQLLAAEQMGALVRDATVESVRFYPNRFEEWLQQ